MIPHLKNETIWIAPQPEAVTQLIYYLNLFLSAEFKQKCPVILCLGTPKLLGDCLGPIIGTLLRHNHIENVYGTLDAPVHALSLDQTLTDIKKIHPSAPILSVDASIGSIFQSGYITLSQGPLYPGCGLGKKMTPVGDFSITGVFHELSGPLTAPVLTKLSTNISHALMTFLEKK